MNKMIDEEQGNMNKMITNAEIRLFKTCENLVTELNYRNVDMLDDMFRRRRSPRFFDINTVNAYGMTALSMCLSQIPLKEGVCRVIDILRLEILKTDVVNVLIKNGACFKVRIPIGIRGYTNSMLHVACEKNNPLNVVKLLLEKGLNVNDINRKGQTPLHIAARCMNSNKILLLLEYGANVNVLDKYGDSPITFLIYTYYTNVIHIEYEKRLLRVDRCLNLLLRNNSSLNNIGKLGGSCLFLTIIGLGFFESRKKTHFIKKIINSGAEINIGCRKEFVKGNITFEIGDTPLHAAVKTKDLEVVKLLLANKADIFHVNSCDKSAYEYAMLNEESDITDAILIYYHTNYEINALADSEN
jgi:ankyrin repeat protein